MALQPQEQQQNNYNSMVFQREEFMISLNDNSIPTLRNANFLKPMFNTTNIQQIPKKPPHFTSNPNIFDQLKGKIMLKGIKCPRESWKLWVEKLEKTHQTIWKKVGIFDAIKASTYKINKDINLIIYLGQKWCIETNTFIFPWGECSITLEDVMILGGFPVLGDLVTNLFRHRSSEELLMEKKLESCVIAIKRANFGNLAMDKWVKYFEGKNGELEHIACLYFWLSRYVFCTDSSVNNIDTDIFSVSFRLVKGTRVSLACGVLASIYRDLNLLKRRILGLNGGDGGDLDLWSLLQLVQVWAWERFRTISPKPLCLAPGEPRIARWHNVRKNDRSSSRIDEGFVEELFLWRPYGIYVKNWEFPKFYGDEEMWVVINSEVDDEFLSLATCLRDCRLEGLDCVEWYLPHRVAMQFGFDQDVPDFVPRKGLELVVEGGIRCYVPPRLLEGDITVQYLKWWKGASTLRDQGVQVACRPQDYSSPRYEPMQVESMSCKEIFESGLARVENLASESRVSLVPDSAVKDGKMNEHMAIRNEKTDCIETNETHISSLVVVNNAVTETDIFTEMEKISGENSTSENEDANRINKVCDDDAVNEAMQVDSDSVIWKEILRTELAPLENLASQSQVSLVPDSRVEVGKTSENIADKLVPDSRVGVGKTSEHIADKLVPGSETDKFTEQVERVCGDMQEDSVIPCSTPICTGLGEENPPSEHEEANEKHEARDNDVIMVDMVDIDEMSDDEDDNPLESICKRLDERLSLLETTVAKIMADKSGS